MKTHIVTVRLMLRNGIWKQVRQYETNNADFNVHVALNQRYLKKVGQVLDVKLHKFTEEELSNG